MIEGLHHVTAVAGEPGPHLAFYRETLGLRLVKRTVNFDAPESWHLYYVGGQGPAGGVLTFFLRPELRRGRPGPGQVTRTTLGVPPGSLGKWEARLEARGVPMLRNPDPATGTKGLLLEDPDGLPLALVETEEEEAVAGPGVRGIAGVELTVGEAGPTVRVLGALGWREGVDRWLRVAEAARPEAARPEAARPEAEGRDEATTPAAGAGRDGPAGYGRTARAGRSGVGTVHHVALRVPDDGTQAAARRTLLEQGLSPTPVVDRHYFRSVYAREPGGVLLELATTGPGFAVDEPPDRLGERLVLPPWLESRRTGIERSLPPLA